MTELKIKDNLLVVCAWCDHFVGANGKAARPAPEFHREHPDVSHGICTDCYRAQLEAIERMKRGERP